MESKQGEPSVPFDPLLQLEETKERILDRIENYDYFPAKKQTTLRRKVRDVFSELVDLLKDEGGKGEEIFYTIRNLRNDLKTHVGEAVKFLNTPLDEFLVQYKENMMVEEDTAEQVEEVRTYEGVVIKEFIGQEIIQTLRELKSVCIDAYAECISEEELFGLKLCLRHIFVELDRFFGKHTTMTLQEVVKSSDILEEWKSVVRAQIRRKDMQEVVLQTITDMQQHIRPVLEAGGFPEKTSGSFDEWKETVRDIMQGITELREVAVEDRSWVYPLGAMERNEWEETRAFLEQVRSVEQQMKKGGEKKSRKLKKGKDLGKENLIRQAGKTVHYFAKEEMILFCKKINKRYHAGIPVRTYEQCEQYVYIPERTLEEWKQFQKETVTNFVPEVSDEGDMSLVSDEISPDFAKVLRAYEREAPNSSQKKLAELQGIKKIPLIQEKVNIHQKAQQKPLREILITKKSPDAQENVVQVKNISKKEQQEKAKETTSVQEPVGNEILRQWGLPESYPHFEAYYGMLRATWVVALTLHMKERYAPGDVLTKDAVEELQKRIQQALLKVRTIAVEVFEKTIPKTSEEIIFVYTQILEEPTIRSLIAQGTEGSVGELLTSFVQTAVTHEMFSNIYKSRADVKVLVGQILGYERIKAKANKERYPLAAAEEEAILLKWWEVPEQLQTEATLKKLVKRINNDFHGGMEVRSLEELKTIVEFTEPALQQKSVPALPVVRETPTKKEKRKKKQKYEHKHAFRETKKEQECTDEEIDVPVNTEQTLVVASVVTQEEKELPVPVAIAEEVRPEIQSAVEEVPTSIATTQKPSLLKRRAAIAIRIHERLRRLSILQTKKQEDTAPEQRYTVLSQHTEEVQNEVVALQQQLQAQELREMITNMHMLTREVELLHLAQRTLYGFFDTLVASMSRELEQFSLRADEEIYPLSTAVKYVEEYLRKEQLTEQQWNLLQQARAVYLRAIQIVDYVERFWEVSVQTQQGQYAQVDKHYEKLLDELLRFKERVQGVQDMEVHTKMSALEVLWSSMEDVYLEKMDSIWGELREIKSKVRSTFPMLPLGEYGDAGDAIVDVDVYEEMQQMMATFTTLLKSVEVYVQKEITEELIPQTTIVQKDIKPVVSTEKNEIVRTLPKGIAMEGWFSTLKACVVAGENNDHQLSPLFQSRWKQVWALESSNDMLHLVTVTNPEGNTVKHTRFQIASMLLLSHIQTQEERGVRVASLVTYLDILFPQLNFAKHTKQVPITTAVLYEQLGGLIQGTGHTKDPEKQYISERFGNPIEQFAFYDSVVVRYYSYTRSGKTAYGYVLTDKGKAYVEALRTQFPTQTQALSGVMKLLAPLGL